MQSSPTRILLVEDFNAYRSLTVRLLSHNPDLEVISEAKDGPEAVAQAQQLRPDLVLMDIGLPKLNGLEAARRIRELVPAAKLIFLTQETDVDVVREAFSLSACGYVLKQDAEIELLAAVSAALANERFMSKGLRENGLH